MSTEDSAFTSSY